MATAANTTSEQVLISGIAEGSTVVTSEVQFNTGSGDNDVAEAIMTFQATLSSDVGRIFTPADPPATSPAEQPVSNPADPPVTSRTEPPAISPVDLPATNPADAPTTNLVDPPTASPADPPVTNPADALTANSADPPGTTPADAPATNLADPLTASPVDPPVANPAAAPTTSPADRVGAEQRSDANETLSEEAHLIERQRQREQMMERQRQREQMMEITAAICEQQPATTGSVTRAAELLVAVSGGVPSELSPATRASARELASNMAALISSGSAEVALTGDAAAGFMDSLSSVAVGAVGGANQSTEISETLEVVGQIAFAHAQELVPGEEPVTSGSEVLSYVVQYDDLDSSSARAFSDAVIAPNAAALTLPPSIGGQSRKHLGKKHASLGAAVMSMLRKSKLRGAGRRWHNSKLAASMKRPLVSMWGAAKRATARSATIGAAVSDYVKRARSGSQSRYAQDKVDDISVESGAADPGGATGAAEKVGEQQAISLDFSKGRAALEPPRRWSCRKKAGHVGSGDYSASLTDGPYESGDDDSAEDGMDGARGPQQILISRKHYMALLRSASRQVETAENAPIGSPALGSPAPAPEVWERRRVPARCGLRLPTTVGDTAPDTSPTAAPRNSQSAETAARPQPVTESAEALSRPLLGAPRTSLGSEDANAHGTKSTLPEPAPAHQRTSAGGQALFAALGINLSRLQLCVPLDYLESMALMELAGDGRRERVAIAQTELLHRKNSRKQKDEEDEEDEEEGDMPVGINPWRLTRRNKESTSGRSVRERDSSSLADDSHCEKDTTQSGVRSMSEVVSNPMEELTEKEPHPGDLPPGDLEGGAIEGGPQAGAVMEGVQGSLENQHIRPSLRNALNSARNNARTVIGNQHTRSLRNVVSSALNSARTVVDVAIASDNTIDSRSRWGMVRLRQELSVERMLGTALVQAFLDIRSLISREDLQMQMDLAIGMPWQMPNNRPFTWIRVFARSLTECWTEDYQQCVKEMHQQHMMTVKLQRAETIRIAPLRGWSMLTKQMARRAWGSCMKKGKWIMRAHPLASIYMVQPLEPFSRSQRILIQFNTFILMLTFVVWFYYSKAVTCCQDKRVFLQCAASGDVTEPCLGFPTCAMLRRADRVTVILIMVGVLSPVTVALQQLFVMSSAESIPKHWQLHVTAVAEKRFGPKFMATMQMLAVALYSVLFDLKKMNKTMASVLVAIMGTFMPISEIRRFFRAISTVFRWMANLAGRGFWRLWVLLFGTALLARQGTRKGERRIQVRLSSPMENTLQKVAYSLIVGMWAVISWSLFTYVMLIREMLGPEAERSVVQTWALTLLMETCGKDACILICVRLLVLTITERVE
eukprot:gene2443-3176_t